MVKNKKRKKLTMTFEGNPKGNLTKVIEFIVLEELKDRKIID